MASNIDELIAAIKANPGEDVVNTYIENISDDITNAAKIKSFYDLPFEVISSIVRKVDFNNTDEPQTLLKIIASGVNKSHQTKGILGVVNKYKRECCREWFSIFVFRCVLFT